MKYITCIRVKNDLNGDAKYCYNFVDTDKLNDTAKNNKEFSCFGRATKAGLVNQSHPLEMTEWMRKPFVLLGLPSSLKLTKLIKKSASQSEIKKQRSLIEYLAEFLKLPINI